MSWGLLVWKRSWAFRAVSGPGEWYGYAFGLPDRHRTVVVWRGPARRRGLPGWFRWGVFGARVVV